MLSPFINGNTGSVNKKWMTPCNKYRRGKNPILISPIFGYNAPMVKGMHSQST